jgi:isopenicillin-N epimerase
MLDPDVAYLNHGSFGARPTAVFEAQIALKRAFEQAPMQFLDREGKDRIQEAREVISGFLGCSADQLGFVENATTGVGSVINSQNFPRGSEILTTSHVYNGVRQLLKAASIRNGWVTREVDIPTPIRSSQEIVSTIRHACTAETKMLVLDHVASITGILFPVQELIAMCRELGILILIDGAHAPGMVHLAIDTLNPDWYVGNLHKWVCGPPGAGFLWTNTKHLDSTRPLTISHFFEQGFLREFDWQGTRDITSILGASIAVQWGAALGWDRIRAHNHSFTVSTQRELVATWKVEPLAPLDGSLLGSMATVQLPVGFPNDQALLDEIRAKVYDQFKIEIPFLLWQGRPHVRISGQIYNRISDIERLKTAVFTLLRTF